MQTEVYIYRENNESLSDGEMILNVHGTFHEAEENFFSRVSEFFGEKNPKKILEKIENDPEATYLIKEDGCPYLSALDWKDNRCYFVIEKKSVNLPERSDTEIRKYCQDGWKLLAEVNGDPEYKEIFIGLESPSGEYRQDIAVIGEEYHYEDGIPGPVPEHGHYTVKIFEGPGDSYTKEVSIVRRGEQ